MKFPMEDTDSEMPEFATVLSYLWISNTSVNSVTAAKELRVIPSPPEEIIEMVRNQWDLLLLWLPGVCDSCSLWSMQRSEIPFGAHAHLCPFCTDEALVIFEKRGWPEPTWHKGELGEA